MEYEDLNFYLVHSSSKSHQMLRREEKMGYDHAEEERKDHSKKDFKLLLVSNVSWQKNQTNSLLCVCAEKAVEDIKYK